jgi:hypothetical protein
MKTTPIQYWSTSKGEFSEPPPKLNLSSGSELHPSLKAMVQAEPFSRRDNENPYHHLHECWATPSSFHTPSLAKGATQRSAPFVSS